VKLFDTETYDISDGIDLADTGQGATIFATAGAAGAIDFIEWQVDAGPISLDEIFFRANHDASSDPNAVPPRSLSRVRILADTDPGVNGYETVLVNDSIDPVYDREPGNLLAGTSLAKVYPVLPNVTARAFRAEFTRAADSGPRVTELSAAIRADCDSVALVVDDALGCVRGAGTWLGAGCYCGDRDRTAHSICATSPNCRCRGSNPPKVRG
jgi:hypothetical protein